MRIPDTLTGVHWEGLSQCHSLAQVCVECFQTGRKDVPHLLEVFSFRANCGAILEDKYGSLDCYHVRYIIRYRHTK